METQLLLYKTRRWINLLKKTHWPPMSYMAIPSLLNEADNLIEKLTVLVKTHPAHSMLLNELKMHRALFKRVTDYHENGQSKYKHSFHFKINEHFPQTLHQGIEEFREKFDFYPTKVILHQAVFERLNEAFVDWSWHKIPYPDQSFDGITVCFEWLNAEHGKTSHQVRLTGLATERYRIYFICYSSAENNIEASKAVAARNLSPEEENEKELERARKNQRRPL
jgi:hypothetical protein